MGASIQRLPESLVLKIAAGEVIERPASVVKELVENALDAGASRIGIEIEEAGRQAIRVADNGLGMPREDVELCTERHATSKMRTPTDLFTISTMGFRGEALASIAAVSRLTVESRPAGGDEGTRLVVEGGVQRELLPAGRDVGTTIEVRGLFYNTPARRKFLRHRDTELRHVTQAVVALAAARPEVSFRLDHGGRQILDLPPGERDLRAAELLRLEAGRLLALQREAEVGGGEARVEGFLTPPGECGRARSRQYVVVRQRPIACRPLTTAVYNGYGSLLPHNAHPEFVLWLDLDPRHLDVNVHPTKREVRFSREPELRQLVQEAVRDALKVPEARAYSYPSGEDGEAAPAATARVEGPAESRTGYLPEPESEPWDGSADQMRLTLLPAAPVPGEPVPADAAGRKTLGEARRSTVSWQIHDKYVLIPIRDGLLVVDQHVAHERVRFEEVQDALETEGGASQQLLVPLTVTVSPVEMEAFLQARELFERLGFGVREFGPGSLLLDAIPPGLRHWGDGDLFHEILSDLIEELDVRLEVRDAVAASMACHTSIRAGERLSVPEMETLVRKLLNAREPFACPHGRPILIKILLQELDRLFHRT